MGLLSRAFPTLFQPDFVSFFVTFSSSSSLPLFSEVEPSPPLPCSDPTPAEPPAPVAAQAAAAGSVVLAAPANVFATTSKLTVAVAFVVPLAAVSPVFNQNVLLWWDILLGRRCSQLFSPCHNLCQLTGATESLAGLFFCSHCFFGCCRYCLSCNVILVLRMPMYSVYSHTDFVVSMLPANFLSSSSITCRMSHWQGFLTLFLGC